jgi:AcrR family transcriptional regulator
MTAATGKQANTLRRQRNKRGEGAKLRAMILDSAQSLLEESGDEASVTIRAVTRRAGIAPQSFYLQFPSLGSLLFAMYGTAFQALHDALVSAGNDAPDPHERLAVISRAYVDFALSNPGRYRALMSSRGVLHDEWDQNELPGAGTFALLRDAVAAARASEPGDAQALHVAATLAWTQLHGMSVLMIDRPTFPWPPVETLLGVVLNQWRA